jgi:putative SOS response-associated peptidase YedK
MTRAYRLDATSHAIAQALGADQGPDPWGGGALSPGEFAPVVTRSQKTGQRVIRPLVWGYLAPGADGISLLGEVRWVPTVRNTESPFWIGNLRHSELRCLVPATSFMLKNHWFAVPDSSVFAFAGIWRDLTDMPVFAILVTDSTGEAKAKGAATMPCILEVDHYDRWLRADWKEAQDLVAPYAGVLTSCA